MKLSDAWTSDNYLPVIQNEVREKYKTKHINAVRYTT